MIFFSPLGFIQCGKLQNLILSPLPPQKKIAKDEKNNDFFVKLYVFMRTLKNHDFTFFKANSNTYS